MLFKNFIFHISLNALYFFVLWMHLHNPSLAQKASVDHYCFPQLIFFLQIWPRVWRQTASYLLFSSVGSSCCFSSSERRWRGVWLCFKTLYKHRQALFLTQSCKWGYEMFLLMTLVSWSFSETSPLAVLCIQAFTLALVLV